MLVRFQRLDRRQHRMCVLREAGQSIDAVLETRSLLLHDFAHYSLESVQRYHHGFFGLLAAGCSLEDLRAGRGVAAKGPLMAIEREVALLQSAYRWNRTEPLGKARTARCYEVLRSIDGAWSKVKRAQALELWWPDPEPRVVSV